MRTVCAKNISIRIGDIKLEGELTIPHGSSCIVIFSHGSGSSRFSSRNKFVAKELHENNISTLLFDLLTAEEDEFYPNRFNIELLTQRLVEVTTFVKKQPECSAFKIGYFGASTGAASAVRAAAFLPNIISAIVSRGGRPDLAADLISEVKAPTLLIVGEQDTEVLNLNQEVFELLNCPKRLEIIPGATHLFEEPGKLKEVALVATSWFSLYLK
ncbi:MAG: alpha/beta hydrolase [Bacteroidota bacterium]|nr:alpha/beta hydrolase [Bacteroidota bacterium]